MSRQAHRPAGISDLSHATPAGRLLPGDVLISPHGTRWTVVVKPASAKLNAVNDQGHWESWWWREAGDLPKGWTLERCGMVIR